jgi:hypothetical protein
MTSLMTLIDDFIKHMFERGIINPTRTWVSNSFKDFVKFSADRMIELANTSASSDLLDVEERCGDFFAVYCGKSQKSRKRCSDIEFASMPLEKKQKHMAKQKKKATQGNEEKSNNGGM